MVGADGGFAGQLEASATTQVTFPQFSEAGVWTVEFVFLVVFLNPHPQENLSLKRFPG